jgi:hypothetical protein
MAPPRSAERGLHTHENYRLLTPQLLGPEIICFSFLLFRGRVEAATARVLSKGRIVMKLGAWYAAPNMLRSRLLQEQKFFLLAMGLQQFKLSKFT